MDQGSQLILGPTRFRKGLKCVGDQKNSVLQGHPTTTLEQALSGVNGSMWVGSPAVGERFPERLFWGFGAFGWARES